MFCPKCGKDIPDQVKFCPKCGTAISSAAPGTSTPPVEQSPAAPPKTAAAVAEKPPKKAKKEKKSGGKGKLILIAAAVVIAAVLILLPKPSPEVPDQSGAEGPAVTQGTEAELLALVDEVDAALKATFDTYNTLEDADYTDEQGYLIVQDYLEGLQKQLEALSGFLTELDGLSAEADAISIPDGKLKTAVDEYFNMMRYAMTGYLNGRTFYTDYMGFYYNLVAERPLEVDYAISEYSQYSQDLDAWYQDTMAGYAAISAPSSVESEWKQYKAILEYNESVVQKVALAVQCNDWLRLYSARYMTQRYMTAEKNQFQKLLQSANSEVEHSSAQGTRADALREELHAYCELTPEEREAYRFENTRIGTILLDYKVVDTIYPSLYNTYDAFAIIQTGCYSGVRDIVVEAEIEGFTQQYKQSFRLDSSYKAIYIKPPALTGELNLSAAKPAQLKISVYEKDGSLIDVQTFTVELKSKNDFDWYSSEYGSSTQDNILCFLTPESDKIARLKRLAMDEMAAMAGGQYESFVGYQNLNSSWNKYATTYLETAGLMRALSADLGVRYNMNPFSLSGSNQHIQLPDEVINSRSGLCVETSLVIASALQSANMHAFLVFPKGHAQVAVEAWNSGNERGEYFLIETTVLDSASNTQEHFVECLNDAMAGYAPTGIITYYSASQWRDYLENEVEYVVDCDDSRLLGMTPFAN